MKIFFGIVTWLLSSFGLYKISEKCGKKSRLTFVPALRYLPIGECAGRQEEARKCFILELLVFVFSLIVNSQIPDSRVKYAFVIIAMVAALFLLISEARLYDGLRQVFNASRIWLLVWVFASGLAAVIWGFSKKFQPVRLGTDDYDDLLAGTVPADIDTSLLPVTSLPENEGLHIHIRDRRVRVGAKTRYLLKDIHLAIPNKSLVLLLGGSGSGKTTFVNAVNGYEKANATITLNGEDIYANYSRMKYRLGFVPQQELMRMNDTVYRTISDAAKIRLPAGTSEEERKQKIDSVMDTLGLTAGKGGLVSKKSGGMKKRISIAMELVSDPELFILDEPDSGLDGVIARELFEKLREITDRGKIVIAITHTPDRVADLFDKVIVLARDSGRVGRLAFYGSPDEARAFFGKNTMEEVVMTINSKDQGGEGRADEFIARYAKLAASAAAVNAQADNAAGADAAAAAPDAGAAANQKGKEV
ncbi:MAG: ABC transporter ATP-binding protein [Clostridium sp.]|nr:ABC transporter ATP-binding protein [Clostridium sp.]